VLLLRSKYTDCESKINQPENEMTQFNYRSTGEAYDSVMCGVDGVKTGDTIIIESEQVVGLAWAWPVAVTVSPGELHSTDKGVESLSDSTGERVFTDEQIRAARIATVARGYKLA
jgi:hypothetical protein